MRVIVVENDLTKSARLTAFLKAEGIQVEATDSGQDALELVRHYDFDLVLLNLVLPDMPGSTVISRMRAARHDTPVLAFSASLSTEPKLKALAAGADDVVERTIDQTELLARMRAIVRRSRGHSQPKLQFGALTLDTEHQEVIANGKTVSLPAKEFAILQLLMVRKNMVLTKEAILTNLYGGMDEPEVKIIDVFICKIRKKLTDAGVSDVISTVWGRGYTVRDIPHHKDVPAEPLEPQPAQQFKRDLVAAWS